MFGVIFETVILVAMIAAGIGILKYVVSRYVLAPKREREWAEALRIAQWRDVTTTHRGRVEVTVQKVAKGRDREERVGQPLVIGRVSIEHEDFQQELDDLWARARLLAHQLNNGPLR
jgi:hypothetical protein